MTARVRLQRVEPGSWNVAGSELFLLAHHKGWAIYDRAISTAPAVRCPSFKACREYLDAHPELWS
jgi:hypothetical protein